MVAVVPKSLVKPVPASRARSQIQAQIDASRARVERLNEQTKRQLVRQLLELERELRDRLDRMRREGRGDAWTSADTEATLVQVRELLGRQGREFGALLGENTVRARALGVRGTVGVLQHFEEATGGPIRPLALAAAIAAQDPLLLRHQTSVARYGMRTIERVAGVMQRGLIEGATFDEMKKRLTSGPGPLVQSAGDAARIVRTEGMHAYNAGAHEEALAQRAARFPDLQKKLIETFDIRTAEDSRAAHGQVKDLEGVFVDGKGRRYLHPPGRPNDRGVQIPWRKAWAGSASIMEAPALSLPISSGVLSRQPGEEVSFQNRFARPPPEVVFQDPFPLHVVVSDPFPPLRPIGSPPKDPSIRLPDSRHIEVIDSKIPKAEQDAILSVLAETNLLEYLARHKLKKLLIEDKMLVYNFPGWDEANQRWVFASIRSEGNTPDGTRDVYLAGRRDPDAIGRRWHVPLHPDGSLDSSRRPWSVSTCAHDNIEGVRRTLVHEMGHHILRCSNSSTPEPSIATIIARASKSRSSKSLVGYGGTDPNQDEYFCECLSMYAFYREDLRKHDPVGFTMVEEVLRSPHVGILQP